MMGTEYCVTFEDFAGADHNGVHVLAHPKWPAAITRALLDAGDTGESVDGGRGSLRRFEFEGNTGLIRPYRRGGLIRGVLHDRYVLSNRPVKELRAHLFALNRGVPVPIPLGIRWQSRFGVYSGAFATAEISGADLAGYLEAPPDDSDQILRRCGAVIRKMHDAGVYHADLQLRNLLVSGGHVYVLDFDNASTYERIPSIQRSRNLLRLRRSFERNGIESPYFRFLLDGYGAFDMPAWLSAAYRIRGLYSDTISGASGAD